MKQGFLRHWITMYTCVYMCVHMYTEACFQAKDIGFSSILVKSRILIRLYQRILESSGDDGGEF